MQKIARSMLGRVRHLNGNVRAHERRDRILVFDLGNRLLLRPILEVESHPVGRIGQQQASLSDDKAQQMQKEIQTRRVELNRLNEDATADMKQQLNDVQGRFQQMLMETLATFGKEKSFTLILNKAVVDFNSQQVDVTQDLIAKFNEVNKAPIGPAPKTQEKKAPAAKPPDKKAPEKPKEPPKDSSKP